MSTDYANINAAGVDSVGSYAPDRLFDRHTIRRKRTLLAGRAYTRGEVLGKIDATGKRALSAAAAVDGSGAPIEVLLETVDATGGDKEAIVAIAGHFNSDALILGVGHTLASIEDALTVRGIYFEPVIG